MFHIKKIDNDRQIVYGEVYAPNVVDSHGDMMLAEDVEQMAHGFLRNTTTLASTIDTNHDNWPNGSYPIESFIATADMLGWTEGAWVLGVKVVDANVWKKVKSGELAGFSFEGRAKKQPADVELVYRPYITGITEPAPDGHVHHFVVKVNERGKVVAGNTSVTNGHSHAIARGTATEPFGIHKHRYFIT